jgi:hypothetical protein
LLQKPEASAFGFIVVSVLHQTMQLVRFGYDKNPEYHARGWAKADGGFPVAYEDSRGFGWQIVCRYGSRSRHMTEAKAKAILLEE